MKSRKGLDDEAVGLLGAMVMRKLCQP